LVYFFQQAFSLLLLDLSQYLLPHQKVILLPDLAFFLGVVLSPDYHMPEEEHHQSLFRIAQEYADELILY
jgi:hypothetical protein